MPGWCGKYHPWMCLMLYVLALSDLPEGWKPSNGCRFTSGLFLCMSFCSPFVPVSEGYLQLLQAYHKISFEVNPDPLGPMALKVAPAGQP